MKRVMMFGGCIHRPAEDLNAFLAKHPDFELLDVKPVKDGLNNILLYCIMNAPDDVRGLPERIAEYLGYPGEDEENESGESE